MNLVEQIFAVIGIAATVLLAIQMVLLILGLGDSGADVSADSAGGDTNVGDSFDVDATTGDVSMEVPQDAAGVDIHPGDWYGDGPTGDFTAEATTVDAAAGGLRLFTLQGLIAFFAVFGWSGLLLLKSGLAPAASVVLSVLFGLAAMLLMAWLFKAMLRLQQDGTMNIKNALGKSGTVYMNIPAKRENRGKISIVVQDRLVELDAVTDEEEPIKTGAEVTVVGISNNAVLIVRRK